VHYVIIGASAAGISAVETLCRLVPDAKITLISKEKDIAYSRCLTTYYISDKVSRDKLFIRSQEQLEGLGITIITGIEAVSVDVSAKSVNLSDGRKINYHRLLAASGSTPIVPDIPGIEAKGIFALRKLEDAQNIHEYLPRTDSAILLGDGLVAVTTALALNSRGIKVSVVGIAAHLMATFLDQHCAEILQKTMVEMGIQFYLESTVKQIKLNQSGEISGIILDTGINVNAGLMVVAVGVKPELDYLANTGISTDIGIKVNDYLETNVEGIFAAGDAAQCFDYVRQKSWWNPLWPNAVEQGEIAARNMAGQKRAYIGCTNLNAVNIDKLSLICGGETNKKDKDNEEYVIKDLPGNYEKLVFSADRLIGFILLGNTEKAGVLTSLLMQKSITSTQKENLVSRKYNYVSLSGLVPLRN
jgi:nitrite reductase (NADH) large subunit